MFARIYQPSKTAMQSGRANTQSWRLEFEPETAQRTEPLMGWTSASDMNATQLRLRFDTKEEAVAYARQRGIAFQVSDTPASQPVPKAYSDNFAYKRRKPWTH